MLCPRCGSHLLDSATFCPECGAPIDHTPVDFDERSAISALGDDYIELSSQDEFIDTPLDIDYADFDDSGVIEELGSLDDLLAEQPKPKPQPEPEPEPEPEPVYNDRPIEVNVQPLAYETETFQPVYQAYTGYDIYSNNAYGNQPYGAYVDQPYMIPETAVPDTYAHVKPISGGVPTEHYLSRKRRRRRKLISFMILLIFLAAAGGVAWYTWDQEMWGGKRVPQVVGMTEDAARSALTVKGLTAEIDPIPSDSGFGNVLGSDPAEGKRCSMDTPVILQVASERKIPNVVGMNIDEARAALADEGATNIVLTYKNSDAEEGTVVEVNPPADSIFISTDPVTVTIAQPYTVPAVVGSTITEAEAAVEAAGLRWQLEYVQSWATRDTITAVSPDAGTRVTENAAVTLYAPIPYPSTVYELPYYYRLESEQISYYLNYLNYTLEQGGTYYSGEGYERWKGATGDTISFTNEPESATGAYGTTDVLAEGAKWTAVRYQCAKGSAASKMEVSEDNLRTIVKACGLGGEVVDTCTQTDIITPYAINRDAYDFVCMQGEWGDYVWVALISRGNSVTNTVVTPGQPQVSTEIAPDGTTITRQTTEDVTTTYVTPAEAESTVIVALMPEETTNVSGLSSYGNSFCDYFAYANLYSSNRSTE